MMMAMCAGSASKLISRARLSSGDPLGIVSRSCSSDMTSEGYRTGRIVINANEIQPRGWRRWSRRGSVSRTEQISHRRRGPATVSDLDERANNRTHHVFEKACSLNLVRKNAPSARDRFFGPAGSRHRARTGSQVAALRLKAGKVVFADQLARGLVHGRQIELS